MNIDLLSRKARDKHLQRCDILKASEHVFALKGYSSATMQDIESDIPQLPEMADVWSTADATRPEVIVL